MYLRIFVLFITLVTVQVLGADRDLQIHPFLELKSDEYFRTFLGFNYGSSIGISEGYTVDTGIGRFSGGGDLVTTGASVEFGVLLRPSRLGAASGDSLAQEWRFIVGFYGGDNDVVLTEQEPINGVQGKLFINISSELTSFSARRYFNVLDMPYKGQLGRVYIEPFFAYSNAFSEYIIDDDKGLFVSGASRIDLGSGFLRSFTSSLGIGYQHRFYNFQRFEFFVSCGFIGQWASIESEGIIPSDRYEIDRIHARGNVFGIGVSPSIGGTWHSNRVRDRETILKLYWEVGFLYVDLFERSGSATFEDAQSRSDARTVVITAGASYTF